MLQHDRRTTGFCKILALALVFSLVLLLPLQQAFAQTASSRDDDLLRFVTECGGAVPAPFKSVADLRWEIDCVAALVKAQGNSSRTVESPAMWITAQTGPWEYRYDLDGALQDVPACVVTSGLVLPVGRAVKVSLSSTDTIHEWRLPSLGIKATAIPGRINTATLRSEAAGVVEGLIVRNEDSAKASSTPFTVRFLAETEYSAWERRTLRAKGCGR